LPAATLHLHTHIYKADDALEQAGIYPVLFDRYFGDGIDPCVVLFEGSQVPPELILSTW